MKNKNWTSLQFNIFLKAMKFSPGICILQIFLILIGSSSKSSPPLFFTELRSDSIKFLGQREEEGGDII